MFRLLFEDSRSRMIAAFSTNSGILDNAARRWLVAFDAALGPKYDHKGKQLLFRVWANVVTFLLRPVWWYRGY